jgi:hypothetical protein
LSAIEAVTVFVMLPNAIGVPGCILRLRATSALP